jgi:hypothetical protein
VGARRRADLAELADWVEGLRAAAQKAREEGNPTLADSLDITSFEVYMNGISARSCTNKANQASDQRYPTSFQSS